MPKKTVIWSPEARADLRAIDRQTALRILRSIDSYLTTGAGDVKKLQPPRHEFRLRVVQPLFDTPAWTDVGVTNDLATIPRVIAAEKA